MLLLNSITSKLQLVTSAAGAIDVQSSWIDASGTTITPGGSNIASIVTAATTDIVPAPAASTNRNIKDLSVRNTSASVANVVTLVHTDGTTPKEKFKCSLAVGESFTYDQSGDFQVYDVTGALKTVNVTPGAFLRLSVLTAGTTVVLGATTRAVRVQLRAGGGGGGGATLVAGAAGAAGGGAQGGFADKHFTGVSPGSTLTYALGAAGAAGANTGGTGGTGGNTTITVNGVLVTANGGLGGVGIVSVAAAAFPAGGAAPANSTNGDINGSGDPGVSGIQVSGTAGRSGIGGGEGAGQGLSVAGAGNAARASSGAGGGGGLVLNGSAAVIGGAGGAGFIFLEEFA